MGKVIKILEKIRQMSDKDLFKRFEEVGLDNVVRSSERNKPTKEDTVVKVEAGLIKEEILKRMLNGPIHDITEDDERRNHKEEVKDKVISKLLYIINAEVDYWTLEETRNFREALYNTEVCEKIKEHYSVMEDEISNIMIILKGLN